MANVFKTTSNKQKYNASVATSYFPSITLKIQVNKPYLFSILGFTLDGCIGHVFLTLSNSKIVINESTPNPRLTFLPEKSVLIERVG